MLTGLQHFLVMQSIDLNIGVISAKFTFSENITFVSNIMIIFEKLKLMLLVDFVHSNCLISDETKTKSSVLLPLSCQIAIILQ